jgi:hypothetical protein
LDINSINHAFIVKTAIKDNPAVSTKVKILLKKKLSNLKKNKNNYNDNINTFNKQKERTKRTQIEIIKIPKYFF